MTNTGAIPQDFKQMIIDILMGDDLATDYKFHEYIYSKTKLLFVFNECGYQFDDLLLENM